LKVVCSYSRSSKLFRKYEHATFSNFQILYHQKSFQPKILIKIAILTILSYIAIKIKQTRSNWFRSINPIQVNINVSFVFDANIIDYSNKSLNTPTYVCLTVVCFPVTHLIIRSIIFMQRNAVGCDFTSIRSSKQPI